MYMYVVLQLGVSICCTETASYSIAKFLEIESTEEASSGWMLLSTVNLLAAGPASLVDCMTAASLPSTLVKCLYLFFDLPQVGTSDDDASAAATTAQDGAAASSFSAHERRVLLQKIFVQVNVRLLAV